MTSTTHQKNAVLSLGRIYCDLVFAGAGSMPVLGREIFADSVTIAAGGGAFITSAYFAHRSRPAALVARLGTDTISTSLEDQLARSGADLQFIERAADAGPQMTVAIVDRNERAFLSRRAGTARPATLDAALSWSRATHLHIAEYATLAEIPGLITKARSHGLTVSLDPSWDDTLIHDPGFLEKCSGVDVFLPNLEEALAITGAADAQEALARLAAHFPVVALKAGSSGASVSAHEQVVHQPIHDVPVVDTTGAGDAFNAGFLDAWLDDAPPADCLDAGIVNGAMAVQMAGGALSLSIA